MFAITRYRIFGAFALAGGLVLASCAPKPPPPPPPPPKVVAIPPRPVAPAGASDTFTVPPRDVMGVRKTVNYRLSQAQMTWNVRSAFNVAALNCLGPKYEPIVVAYRSFLKNHAKGLKNTTKMLDLEFREKFGPTFKIDQDAYITQVYNYFALPPTLRNFCDASLVMSQESLAIVPAELDLFSARWLPQLEAVFEQFFLSYDAYRIAAAQWDAQYGSVYGAHRAPKPVTLPQSGTAEPYRIAPVGR